MFLASTSGLQIRIHAKVQPTVLACKIRRECPARPVRENSSSQKRLARFGHMGVRSKNRQARQNGPETCRCLSRPAIKSNSSANLIRWRLPLTRLRQRRLRSFEPGQARHCRHVLTVVKVKANFVELDYAGSNVPELLRKRLKTTQPKCQ
jgi:hypothetical protein